MPGAGPDGRAAAGPLVTLLERRYYIDDLFLFLYRVLYQDVPVAQAKADMNTIWKPGGV